MRVFIVLASVAAVKATNCISDLDCKAGKELCDAGQCRKVNKCDTVTCAGQFEECEKKTGSCVCQDGYKLNSRGECKKNVCENNTNCHKHARCTTIENQQFGYFEEKCTCKAGKRGDGYTACTKDWCGLDMHKCGANAICKPLGADYNYDYDCKCKNGFSGTGSRQEGYGGSGYRSDCQLFTCDETLITPSDPKYEVVLPKESDGFSWMAAQQLCREKGPYWDLTIVDTPQEHDQIMKLTNCATNGFWVGVYKKFVGDEFQTVLENDPNFLNKWKSGQPTSSEKELCVRMRLGHYNDANCRTTFTDTRKSGVGMGYICERHNRRVQDGVKCEQKDNDRVAPFKTAFGCPQPSCLGKGNFNIVDAWWRPSKGGDLSKLYGFTISITVPESAVRSDGNGGSIMLRFADGNRMGNVQTYNLRFWGFYNNNNDILFHTKFWNTDRKDTNTMVITVDNISSPDFPEVFYWHSRINKHACFQNGISRSQRPPLVMDAIVNAFQPGSDAENVRAIAFKDGKVKRIKV